MFDGNIVNQVDKFQVHSANSWETADLGDDDRNQKFLRLMGAAKVTSLVIQCQYILSYLHQYVKVKETP
jgi:hypothetical protein